MTKTLVSTGNNTGFPDGTGIETFAAADGGIGGYSAVVDPADPTKPLKPEASGGLPISTGAATSAKQDTGNTSLASLDAKNPALVAGRVPIDGSGVTQPVSAASLPLPSGASTAAKQPALGTAGAASPDVLSVQGVASMTALKVDGSGVTQPVSAAALPLPTGASTSALQTTGNTSVASIDTKTPTLVTGRVPVDGSGVTQPVSAASLPLPSGASTAAKQPALGTAGTPSTDVLTVQGAASMTALKVDPSGVTSPVSAASLPLPTGASTSALQTTGNTSLSSIDTKTPALSGGRVPVDGSGVTQPVSFGVKATLWQNAPVSRSTVLTTELNALANGAFSAAGTAFDNTTNSDQYVALDIVLASLTPLAGAYLNLYLIQSLDGITYEDVPSSTNPAAHALVATVSLNVTTSTKRVMTPWFYVPPGKWKFVLQNNAGAALGATLNTVTAYTNNDELQA